jgi:simple sugar transport system permease protein
MISAAILQITGRNVLSLGADIVRYNLASRFALESTGLIASPILLDAIAVAVALRMGLWNIGADGQFYMGAWAAAGIGLHLHLAAPLLILLMAIAGVLGGAAWALVPAIVRAYLNVNEIITTLLLNFVAATWITWFSIGIWRDASNSVMQATPPVNAQLPLIPGMGPLDVGFIVPFIMAAAFWWIFRATRWGYEGDVIGGNPKAAQYAGINVARRILFVMLLSGAIAGLAGMIELTGVTYRLSLGITNQYGFSGFIVAALARKSWVALVVGALFVALLLNSGIVLQTEGFSSYIVLAVYGMVVLGLAVGEIAARYRLVFGQNAVRETVLS